MRIKSGLIRQFSHFLAKNELYVPPVQKRVSLRPTEIRNKPDL